MTDAQVLALIAAILEAGDRAHGTELGPIHDYQNLAMGHMRAAHATYRERAPVVVFGEGQSASRERGAIPVRPPPEPDPEDDPGVEFREAGRVR